MGEFRVTKEPGEASTWAPTTYLPSTCQGAFNLRVVSAMSPEEDSGCDEAEVAGVSGAV